MKKSILTFGTISGVLLSVMMAATVPFADKIGFDKGEIAGYTIMVASFLLVFFGIRSYRDNFAQGQITFLKAFAVGISITAIACTFYVVTWEILYFNFLPDFADKYSAYLVEKAKAAGESPAAIQEKLRQQKEFKKIYDNPFFNSAITFVEPFPVGLAVTLLSAAVLRKRRQSQPAQSTLTAFQ